MNLLVASNLCKAFGGVQAVAGVSFTLSSRQLLALIGPNGAGKSTCFNMLNGQLRPDSGSISLDGINLAGMEPREVWRHGVGRTFQITATYGSMTVLENVQMVLLSRERRLFDFRNLVSDLYRDEAMELLSRVGMAPQATRPCNVLAYGDVKRVELAMALANNPRLLLMDEPTAGMSSNERNELMALVAALVKERDMAVLFTEHSMDVVFTYAHKVIVMSRGMLIAEGDPATVRDHPAVQEVYLGSDAMFEEQQLRSEESRHWRSAC